MSLAPQAARVVALGQRAAGDDGVGLEILERLRALAPAGLELIEASDATALVDCVQFPGTVVIVDAMVGPAPGEIRIVEPAALETAALSPVSSHGLSVGTALALAREVAPRSLSPRILVVGVGIGARPPDRLRFGLSPEVEVAVGLAAARILDLAGWSS